MNPRIEKANFEGMPLTGLRGVSTDFFESLHDPEYVYEGDALHRPSPLPRLHTQTAQHSERTIAHTEIFYTSESGEFGNDTLPVYAYRKEIVHAVEHNPVVIISAETGAGKSTQVPQFLLNEGWDHIYLTQPRRAAARNVYERIRSEVAEVTGEYEAQQLVSYQTAGERDGPLDAKIKVITDGLQLVKELNESGADNYDVLIPDEVHEWNSNIEVTLAWMKQEILKKPNLRIVIMSATMDTDRLANYFADVCPTIPPIIEVPGRTYAVERAEKPGSTVLNETLQAAEELHSNPEKHGDSNGILVFQPGKREIYDTIDALLKRLPRSVAQNTRILPLHAKLSVEEQQAAFRSYPGVKIVVATDVAQTSLTIPDIKYVIDSGMQRRMELDGSGVQGLVLNPISQADCDQRAGRAGRVSDGYYVLTRPDLDSEYVPYIAREKFPLPEILRTDINRNTLRIAAVGLDIGDLDLYHPVEPHYIEQAQVSLRMLGALDNHNKITPLGMQMNQYPVNTASARMMVESLQFPAQTRAYMAAIAASKEVGGLPYFAHNVGKRWTELTKETSSDLLAQLDIFIAIQDMTPRQMREYDLDLHNVERAQEQFRKIAKIAGATPNTLLTPTLEEREQLKHCMYAGLINSVYRRVGDGTYLHVAKPDDEREISNRSLVTGKPEVIVGDAYRVEYYAGGELTTRHIVEHVTAARIKDIGKVAMHLAEWQSDGLTMRGGRYMDVRKLSLFGMDLGVTREEEAAPSHKLREIIIDHALNNAGPAQRQLRELKKKLEQLAHLAKDPVKQLTHDQIIDLVHEAAPEDIIDPSIIDNNLRLIIQERGISLESFVSKERYERILKDAPLEITVNDERLPLTYRSSCPLVKHYTPSQISRLQDELYLPDGRQIYFMHEKKRCTLLELQNKLSVASY